MVFKFHHYLQHKRYYCQNASSQRGLSKVEPLIDDTEKEKIKQFFLELANHLNLNNKNEWYSIKRKHGKQKKKGGETLLKKMRFTN